MSRPRPLRYRVLPPLGRHRYGWRIKTPAGGFWSRTTKAEAVALGREKAKGLAATEGRLVQLVVHGRNGRVQFEHTYPRRLDPRRREG